MSVPEAWRILADTDHLNRNIGLPPVDFSPPAGAGAGFVRTARAKAFGAIPVRWKEYPFDWVRERRYAVRREFESGPLSVVVGGLELHADGEGVRVEVFVELTPANLLGRLLIPLIGRRSADNVFAYCDRYLSRKAQGKADPLPVAPHPQRIDPAHVESLLDRLAGTSVQPPLLALLRERILEGTDGQVLRMRPFELADAWGADRMEVLRLFLHATRAGLLELRWELMCPNCRVPKGESSTLRELPERVHCDTCRMDYSMDLDRGVEARFSVHPRVRPAEDHVYCIGGPMRMPHIVAQQHLQPRERRRVSVDVREPLQVRSVGEGEPLRLVPKRRGEGDRELEVVHSGAGWVASRPSQGPSREASPAIGEVILSLRNDMDAPVVAVLEQVEWDKQAATAARITTLQEFRDLFSAEVLAPGQEIGVRNMALIFTDLKESTSLYENLGDAPAYGRVNRHFDLLKDKIAAHHGTIVKTIGDAVMGAFIGVEDALRAALAIQEEIGRWSEAQGIDPPLVLRMGLHHGPVIAVNANDRLDYFGRTVNLAARIERESEGGDVVLLRRVYEEEEARIALKGSDHEVEVFTTQLRGIEGRSELVRLRIAPRSSRPTSLSGM